MGWSMWRSSFGWPSWFTRLHPDMSSRHPGHPTAKHGMAKRPYDSRYWREVVRPRILSRDNHRCQIRYETCEGVGNLVDHIIPWEQGGPWYDDWNLRAACKPCNNRRQHRPEPLTQANSRDW